MSYEPPTPPAGLPAELVDTLNEASPEQLRDVARYAEGLAEHKEREARLEGEPDENDIEERPTIFQTTSPRKRRSRSRKLTTIATTTGGGEKGEGPLPVQRSDQPGRIE